MRTLEKAEKELARGNLWRAKEILQSSILHAGYDLALFEMLGTVLLRMGDMHEAGRFLFLSGARKMDYEAAIGIFLERHRKNAPQQFLAAFGKQARLSTLADYPESVRDELIRRGFPENLQDKHGRVFTSGSGRIGKVITCLTLTLVVITLIILGIVKMREIILWAMS
ncbi:MAG TPA: DUF6584 family protein [Pyrinomonadaceae bacterium]|nr:DUF6584 family protein [Pyrinomonadaceae bacterium]